MKTSIFISRLHFMNSTGIFIDQNGKIRSGWRSIIFLLAIFLFLGIGSAILFYVPLDLENISFLLFIQNVLTFSAAIIVGWLCGKFLENLPFRALGAWFTKNWLNDFVLGLIGGAAAVGAAAFLNVVFSATSFELNRTAEHAAILQTLAVSLGVFVIGAAAEEALFRGYFLQTFLRSNLAWLAILLTSVFFGTAHLANPNASHLAMVNTILAGVWFSVAYLKTRTLWLAFGLHLAWNWTQGAILGIPVSGIVKITPAPIFVPINHGAEILTGGNYGIEGGIACTIISILAIILTWFAPIFKPTAEMLALTSPPVEQNKFTREYSAANNTNEHE